jgi:uncharacterized protein (TIGR03437 family)
MPPDVTAFSKVQTVEPAPAQHHHRGGGRCRRKCVPRHRHSVAVDYGAAAVAAKETEMKTDDGNMSCKRFFWIGVAGLFVFLPHLPGQAFQIVTSTLPNGTLGVAYSQLVAVSGGICQQSSGAATFSIDAGALPAGLTVVSPPGVKQWTIQGVPTASGTFPFTLRISWTHSGAVPPSVFDQNCTDVATKDLSLTIGQAAAGGGGGGGGGSTGLTVDRPQVSATYHTGNGPPPPQIVQVTAQANATVAITAQAATGFGGNWLSVTLSSGSTPASLSINFSVNGLAPAVYTGTVTVQGGGTQAVVAVTLTVVTDATPATPLTVDRTQVSIVYHTGHFPPPAEMVQVTAQANASIAYTAQTATASGGSWLSVTPASGFTPALLGIGFSGSGLAPGVYTGTVTLQAGGSQAGTSQLVIAVTLTVVTDTTLVLQASPASLAFSFVIGGPTPPGQTLSVAAAGGDVVIFQTVATVTPPTNPAWLQFTTSGAATPTTLTVSVNPKNLTPGNYSGAITLQVPGVATSAQTVPVTFSVQVPPVLPTIAPNGVVNAGALSGAVAPGTWVSIFGSSLATTTRPWATADFVGGTLPTALDGVNVTINGRASAVAFISPTQINVLAPDDTATGLVAVQVNGPAGSSSGALVLEQTIAPAFFQFRANTTVYVAGTHADGSLIAGAALVQQGTLGSPAKPGETIVLYGTGFGATQPAISATALVPSALPLANPQDLRVRIGGLDCAIAFAGLISPGLYQFNVVVPQVADGDQTIVAELRGLLTRADLLLTVQH